eukprot:gb/GEZN01010921.1/.p1 GENE.gb/GEZN01010921.1/~~gb/GEZN01010921.1/.p1  ORF type:complete len:356 (+),score=34.49 gb/GEZN01010921.1/:61-1128(+)
MRRSLRKMVDTRRMLKEDGYCVLRSVVDRAKATFWDQKLEDALPIWSQECQAPLEKYLSAVCRWRAPNPLIVQMKADLGAVVHGPVQEAIGVPLKLTGGGIIRKSKYANSRTHAHQDASYRWRFEDKDNRSDSELWAEQGELEAYSSWIALTDSTGPGSLQTLPGSHLGPIAIRQHFLDPDFVDIAETSAWDNAVTLPAQAGDVIVFDARVWHASQPSGDVRRSALALRWETELSMCSPPRPMVNAERYGMDTSGVHIKAALLWLLGMTPEAASVAAKADGNSKIKVEKLVDEVLKKNALILLPFPEKAQELLERYLLLRRAGGMHYATAQAGMVWEPLYQSLVLPVQRMQREEL